MLTRVVGEGLPRKVMFEQSSIEGKDVRERATSVSAGKSIRAERTARADAPRQSMPGVFRVQQGGRCDWSPLNQARPRWGWLEMRSEVMCWKCFVERPSAADNFDRLP